jgi:hypothetical protein
MTATIDTALAALDDYVRGEGSDADVAAYEADLFGRALSGEAPELVFRAALTTTLRQMKERGTIALWLTSEEVAKAQASGLKTTLYELDPNDPKPPDIPADADLFITRVRVDLTGITALDAEVLADDGTVLKRMPDIGFNPADGAIYACCEAELARTASAAGKLTRLWATSASGRRLLLEVRTL